MNLESRHPLLSASLLSLALALAPQQIQAAPRPAPAAPAAAAATATAGTADISSLDILSAWLDAVRMQLTRWLADGSGPAPARPAGAARAARPGAARTPVSIRPAPRAIHRPGGWGRLDCGPQVDPNGNCG